MLRLPLAVESVVPRRGLVRHLVVLVVIALAAAGCGSDDEQNGGATTRLSTADEASVTSTTVSTTTTTTTTGPTTTTTVATTTTTESTTTTTESTTTTEAPTEAVLPNMAQNTLQIAMTKLKNAGFTNVSMEPLIDFEDDPPDSGNCTLTGLTIDGTYYRLGEAPTDPIPLGSAIELGHDMDYSCPES